MTQSTIDSEDKGDSKSPQLGEQSEQTKSIHPVMTCGHAANSIGSRAGSSEKVPACVICSCFDIAKEQPILTGRMARCSYYGKPVKGGWYNSNCCNVCKEGENCSCERPSSAELWFFQQHPDKQYDEFYCACHGAD